MSLIAIAVIVVLLFFAFKAVGMVVRLLIWAVILFFLYSLVAPHLGTWKPW